MPFTKSGIYLPPTPERRPRPAGRRRSPTMGIGAVIEPDGTVAWQDDDWQANALHDAGEQSMLNVYLKELANPGTKYLGLLNDSTVNETDNTMAAVTETVATPPADGYARQAIAAADWTDEGLQGGDYRFSAAEKTFGPATAAWTATHVSLSTTQTTAGVLILTLALSATTNIAINQSFKYILRWTQQ